MVICLILREAGSATSLGGRPPELALDSDAVSGWKLVGRRRGMNETRFALDVDGLEIPAVMTAPEAAEAALLLIPGSVNSDADGDYAPMFPGQPAVTPHAYRDLAEQLYERKVAVLRFAKNGPGTGCVVRDAEMAKARYREFGQRLRVAEAFFEELGRRAPGLRRLAAGHSEGAVVATQLARERGSEVAGLVLLSGPSLPLLRLMIWQRYEQDRAAGGLTPERERQYAEACAWAGDYAAGRPLPPGTGGGNPYAEMLPFFLQPANVPYLRSLEQVDPAAELARTTLPVLLVQGGRDPSVIPANAGRLRAARPDAALAEFPRLQHFYKEAPEGASPEQLFGLWTPSDPAVAAAMAKWMRGYTGACGAA
jgi:alpha-beta hydrolase superfamily lysophospholipase